MKKKDVRRVPVSALPKIYQQLFPFEDFNEVQSACYEKLMSSNENIMLSAPTGSGKTVVAELGIVKEVMESTEPILMLYIAPLRALCQERLRDWINRLSKVGIGVMEYTGDSDTKFPTTLNANLLLCTTPEKIDLATRKWKQRSGIFTRLRLVIVDEIHSVGESRGAVLEAMLTRLIFISDFNVEHSGSKPIRIVALSATVPNYADIGRWLRAPSSNETAFDESFRSTPIERKVIGYREAANEWLFESSLTTRVGGVIREYGMKNGEVVPTLIFCATRKSCERTAEKIVVDFPELRLSSVNKESNRIIAAVKDKALGKLLRQGVGVHTAGLGAGDRAAVENLFASGFIKIVCATSTLAQGINLPAALVIIKGTMHYADGDMCEYEAGAVLQMMGRAGRPQFMEAGRCVVMTSKSRVRTFENVVGAATPVESALLPSLCEHLNAEAALGTIRSVEDARRWAASTFLWVRLPINPLHYGINLRKMPIEKFVEGELEAAIGELKRVGMIELQSDNSIQSLSLGQIASGRGLRVKTAELFSKSKSETVEEVLSELVCASEFDDIVVRQEDRQKMRLLSVMETVSKIRLPQPEDPDFFTGRTKALLLVAGAVGTGKLEDWALAQEFGRVKRTGERLLAGFADIFEANGRVKGALAALSLRRSLRQQMWESDARGERAAQQVKGIGDVYARRLAEAGLRGIQSLRTASASLVERVTGHRAGWGASFLDSVSRIPDYSLSLKLLRMDKYVIRATLVNRASSDPLPEHTGCDIFIAIKDILLSRFHARVVGHLSASFDVEIDVDSQTGLVQLPGHSDSIEYVAANAVAYTADSMYLGIDVTASISFLDDSDDNDDDEITSNIGIGYGVRSPHPGQTRASFPPSADDEIVWEMPIGKGVSVDGKKEKEENVELIKAVEAEAANAPLSIPEVPTGIDDDANDFWDRLEFDE